MRPTTVELYLKTTCLTCGAQWSPLGKPADRATDRRGANRLHQRAYKARQHAAVQRHRVLVTWTRREEYTP